MKNFLLKACLAIWRWLNNAAPKIASPSPLEDEVAAARRDWLDAARLADEVTDGDLIDYAIYLMKANEVRYCYLLRRAKAAGASPGKMAMTSAAARGKMGKETG